MSSYLRHTLHKHPTRFRCSAPHRNPRKQWRGDTIKPPALFGELSIFDAQPRCFHALALTDGTAFRLPQAIVLESLQAHPDAAMLLLAQLGQRLREAQVELAQLQRPHSRAAHTLFDKLNDL